jgi:hypothetical protein
MCERLTKWLTCTMNQQVLVSFRRIRASFPHAALHPGRGGLRGRAAIASASRLDAECVPGKRVDSPSTARIDQPARNTSLEFINLHYRDESSRPRRYYGYRIGWIPRSRHWMAIEAEHVHAKVFAETGTSATCAARSEVCPSTAHRRSLSSSKSCPCHTA